MQKIRKGWAESANTSKGWANIKEEIDMLKGWRENISRHKYNKAALWTHHIHVLRMIAYGDVQAKAFLK